MEGGTPKNWEVQWMWNVKQEVYRENLSLDVWRDIEERYGRILDQYHDDRSIQVVLSETEKDGENVYADLAEELLYIEDAKFRLKRSFIVDKSTLVSARHIEWQVLYSENTWISLPKDLSGAFERHLSSSTMQFFFISPIDGRKVYVYLSEMCQVDEVTQQFVPLRRVSSIQPVIRKQEIWQWLDDTQVWRDYSEDLCLLLEEYFQAEDEFCEIEINGSLFTVDFNESLQTNIKTGFSRVIRRVGIIRSMEDKTVDLNPKTLETRNKGEKTAEGSEKTATVPDTASTSDTGTNRGDLCTICMTNTINILCLPCNHASICSDCLEKITDNRCVICRGEVEQHIKFNLQGV